MRKQKQLFVVEGATLAKEATLSDYNIKTVFLTSKAKERYDIMVSGALAKAEEVFVISDDVADKISIQASSQGIFCVLESKPNNGYESVLNTKRVIVLDNISEPSNLGSIARSAAAFGFDCLVISLDSCDWTSNRAMRASMGGLLHTKVVSIKTNDAIIRLKNDGYSVLAAAIDVDAVNLRELVVGEKLALVIGNETTGLSKQTITLSDNIVTIRTDNRVQSLNAAVAAGILMYSLQ